jgi:hypothetical protein
MLPDPDQTDPEPEASEALDQLRDGIARVRVIVREARQAIGQTPPEGAVLSSDPASDPGEEESIIPAT